MIIWYLFIYLIVDFIILFHVYLCIYIYICIYSSYFFSGKWAWLRLGLHFMKIKEPGKAITALQSTLKADLKDK